LKTVPNVKMNLFQMIQLAYNNYVVLVMMDSNMILLDKNVSRKLTVILKIVLDVPLPAQIHVNNVTSDII